MKNSADFVSSLEVGDVVSSSVVEEIIMKDMSALYFSDVVLINDRYSCDDNYVAFRYLEAANFVEYLGNTSLTQYA